eukprot:1142237-Pelagomonas_calceolata.AAC.2
MPTLPFKVQQNILNYHTGTLFNQKHAVHFKMSEKKRKEKLRRKRNYPIQNTRQKVMLGIIKCEKTPLRHDTDSESDSQGPPKICLTEPLADITDEGPCQSRPNLQLKIADWRSWTYTDGSCQVQNGKIVIGAGWRPPSNSTATSV